MKQWQYVVAAFCLSLSTTQATAQDTSSPGEPTTNIVGGVPVEMVLPWMVHLEVPFRSEDPGSGESDIVPFTCGGTLISPTLVLTAGHCVDQTGSLDNLMAITVTQGVLDLNAPNPTVRKSYYVYRPSNYSAPPRGVRGVPRNDWALLLLNDPINDVAPLQLAPDQSLYEGAPGELLFALGWGRTSAAEDTGSSSLLQVYLDFVDDDLCGTADDIYSSDFSAREMMCAGSWFVGGVGTCNGDSGGPLLGLSPTGEWIQVGITSWGDGCGEAKQPGVFTEVQYFLAEICEQAESERLMWSHCPLAVTNPGNRDTAVGTAIPRGSVQSTARYGSPAYFWSVSGLPPGVQMFLPFNVWPSANSRAEFIGAPTTAGFYHVIVTATDASSPAVSSSVDFVWNVH